ncbi:5400_t:CDS:1, partial [Paraglomus occultum]
MKEARRFKVGTEAHPESKFYIEPDNVEELALELPSGEHCHLYGHRQRKVDNRMSNITLSSGDLPIVNCMDYGLVYPQP